ncbi:hypothetical protein KY290_000668 [Solanum tuberosum]|uniref:Uncharacterized protein n=1 Tax=Solanum tuberosum TaxID=4113 RepID=A0ABQ7WKJ8_SOLTU|nr:hypothetical protein KY289_000731 [Solanum tuberosum]KAH0781070.1 hypothetical protein KY290_000668 [Solanum tuberosum]
MTCRCGNPWMAYLEALHFCGNLTGGLTRGSRSGILRGPSSVLSSAEFDSIGVSTIGRLPVVRGQGCVLSLAEFGSIGVYTLGRLTRGSRFGLYAIPCRVQLYRRIHYSQTHPRLEVQYLCSLSFIEWEY